MQRVHRAAAILTWQETRGKDRRAPSSASFPSPTTKPTRLYHLVSPTSANRPPGELSDKLAICQHQTRSQGADWPGGNGLTTENYGPPIPCRAHPDKYIVARCINPSRYHFQVSRIAVWNFPLRRARDPPIPPPLPVKYFPLQISVTNTPETFPRIVESDFCAPFEYCTRSPRGIREIKISTLISARVSSSLEFSDRRTLLRRYIDHWVVFENERG